MKLNDVLVGAALLALSLAILVHIRTLPNIPGQNIGPAAFPGLLAALLAGCAIALLARGWRARRTGPWIARAAWTRSPPQLIHVALTIGGLVFCALFFEQLGFIACGVALLGVLFASLGVRLALVLPLALGITLLIHTVFYSLLRVPLPWGLLERAGW